MYVHKILKSFSNCLFLTGLRTRFPILSCLPQIQQYNKYNTAFVKQCVSDWNYSHEGPEMLRYALWVDKIIKFLTKFHSELPAKTYIPSEEIIVDRDYQGHCSSCKDDQDHRTSSQRCVSISSSSSVMYRLD